MNTEMAPRSAAGERLPALKAERIQERLRKLRCWRLVEVGPGISRIYSFESRRHALALVDFAAGVFEAARVSPFLELQGNFVTVRVASLEDPGAVSELDFDLAAELDRWRPER
jgi:pterin-4a-carbinolamine dehydratase